MARYFEFYNHERLNQAVGYVPPAQRYYHAPTAASGRLRQPVGLGLAATVQLLPEADAPRE